MNNFSQDAVKESNNGAEADAFAELLSKLASKDKDPKGLELFAISFNNLLEAESKVRGKTGDGVTLDNYTEANPFTFEENLRIQTIHATTYGFADVINSLIEIDQSLYRLIAQVLIDLNKTIMVSNIIKVASLRNRNDWLDAIENKLDGIVKTISDDEA